MATELGFVEALCRAEPFLALLCNPLLPANKMRTLKFSHTVPFNYNSHTSLQVLLHPQPGCRVTRLPQPPRRLRPVTTVQCSAVRVLFTHRNKRQPGQYQSSNTERPHVGLGDAVIPAWQPEVPLLAKLVCFCGRPHVQPLRRILASHLQCRAQQFAPSSSLTW